MRLPSTRQEHATCSGEELVDWVRQAALGAGDATLVLTVPAPAGVAERALAVLPQAYSFVWDPGGEWVWVGGGAAVRLEESREREPGACEADRFLRLRRRAETLFHRTVALTHPACGLGGYVPRLFGGLAFTGGGAREAPWSAFGDGCFTLPRWLYRGGGAGGGGGTLSLALTARDRRRTGRLEAWLERLAAVLESMAAPSGAVESSRRAAPLPPLPRGDVEAWCEEVRRARDAIATGRYEKVVLARRLELELGSRLEPERLLPHLDRTGRGSFRFLFRRPEAAFLGTTPERLVALRGRRICTQALAGSIEGGEGRAQELLASAKDRVEHSFVVRHLVDRLAPLCRRLDWSAEPRIRTLRHLQHLETLLDGELSRDTHVLDLVAALHPTPAVGGVPTAEALSWIVEHERFERGWYAGPVGWLDANGDGEFAVALRACVLAGRRAYLWAGAGLVADSDPMAEYEETELKLTGIVGSLEAALEGGAERPVGRAELEIAGVASAAER